ncbi:MAG: hypothetical protein H6Q02_2018 [Acidobacteria bacterium]|nr:hypothetical protein [Acidobacteriota bacterium]
MRALLVIVLMAAAAAADAATVVLRGGRKVEVASFEQRGNLIVMRHADGRVESYPLNAVDLEATRQANQVAAPAAPVQTPTGPHSPFLAARSTPGAAATTVTNADVNMLAPTPEVGEAGATPTPDVLARVVLLNHQHRRVGDGQWEVAATIANQGGAPATGIVAAVRFLDAAGQVVGSGSATMAGPLAPQQQGTLNAVIAATVTPVQVAFDLQWQSLAEVAPPTPAATVSVPATPRAAPVAAAPPATAPVYGRVVGSSPNSVPSNPNAQVRPGQVSNPGSVPPPPPTAAPSGE